MPEKIQEFEKFYHSDGAWAKLFRQSIYYHATELLMDHQSKTRYITIDKWDSATTYNSFLRKNKQEYERLDALGEVLTLKETRIGGFQSS